MRIIFSLIFSCALVQETLPSSGNTQSPSEQTKMKLEQARQKEKSLLYSCGVAGTLGVCGTVCVQWSKPGKPLHSVAKAVSYVSNTVAFVQWMRWGMKAKEIKDLECKLAYLDASESLARKQK